MTLRKLVRLWHIYFYYAQGNSLLATYVVISVCQAHKKGFARPVKGHNLDLKEGELDIDCRRLDSIAEPQAVNNRFQALPAKIVKLVAK
jgi:hypothetical protein